MGAINNYNFSDFVQAIRNQLGEKSAHRLEKRMDDIKSIFDYAAAHDTDETPDEVLSEDTNGFKKLVQKGINMLRTIHVIGQDDSGDVLEGEFAVKDNDTYKYQNGMWTKINVQTTKSADQIISEQNEKAEIKKQYPYWTDADVDARYEIEHMEYRSAELMEALHSGKSPAKVLEDYNAKLAKIKDRTYTEYYKRENMDGVTFTEQYDAYGRIISRVSKFETEANGQNTDTFTYNPDGSYTQVSIENNGKYKYVYQYDAHGKMISETFNDGEPEDKSKQKIQGDYM